MTINLPETHPELGVPSKIYRYCDVSGSLYAAVYRFDHGGEKTIRPHDGQSWKFPENPAPYNAEFLDIQASAGLESLPMKSGFSRSSGISSLENPDFPDISAPIIIVEGEKCADALDRFGFLGISSMGGSNQAHKTDWSILKGRDVIIWPDHDEAGLKYANSLYDTLRNIGLASLRICNVNIYTLHKVIDICNLKENSLRLEPIDIIPKGWDVADAIDQGWQTDHISAFLNEAVSIENLKDNSSIEKPANDNWPSPDLSILEQDAPPPKFPIDVFTPQIADWLMKTAEGRAAPVDYVAGTLLAATASLIGNTRKASPWGGWSDPCILWIALVGSPSSGKSPAMDPVLDMIKKIEASELPAHENALLQYETDKLEAEMARAKWQKDVKLADDQAMGSPAMPKTALEPPLPMRPRLIIGDATTEALCLAMQSQPKGLLMHRDELAGWFGTFDRYSGGKGGDRPFWLECYGGKAFTQDRIKNGATPITIPHLSASIIGSIQPDKLQSCVMKGDDDGLNARFLYIYPNSVDRRRPRCMADNSILQRAFTRLHKLQMDKDEEGHPKPRIISFSPDASDIFEIWWQSQGKQAPEGKSSGWHGKLAGMALRLSLVLTYLKWATSHDTPEPYQIETETIKQAITLITTYLTPMAERAFGISAITETDQNALILAEWILKAKPTEISVRDLTRGKGPFPANTKSEVVKEACFKLVGYGWLQAEFVREGGTAGKLKNIFKVNPALKLS